MTDICAIVHTQTHSPEPGSGIKDVTKRLERGRSMDGAGKELGVSIAHDFTQAHNDSECKPPHTNQGLPALHF